MAAMPVKGKLTSAQAIEIHGDIILIDCGEGVQINVAKYKVPVSKCPIICISHLHGDHVFGLPGLLSSMEHAQRRKKLIIIGPKGIRQFVESIREMSYQHLSFSLEFIECNFQDRQEVFRNEKYVIQAFPLFHRIPTYGFVITEVVQWHHLIKEAVLEYKLNITEIHQARTGFDIVRNDETIPNQVLAKHKSQPRSYAYCSDTEFNPAVANFVSGVDVLYHESTYTNDMEEKAKERQHSTAFQAATIARLARVGKLVLGHFSSRYHDLSVLENEAKTVFPAVILGVEGMELEILRN